MAPLRSFAKLRRTQVLRPQAAVRCLHRAVREQLHEEGMMQLRRAERSSAGRLLREQHFAVHLVPEPLELYPVHAKLLHG